jgi:hypothetical protein
MQNIMKFQQLQHSHLETIENCDSQLLGDLKSNLASTLDSIKVHSEQCTKDMEHAVTVASSLREKHVSDMSQLKGDITRFFSTLKVKQDHTSILTLLKEDKPTGSTPVKKKITVPLDIPKPLPTDVLLSQASKKHKQTHIKEINKENLVNNS